MPLLKVEAEKLSNNDLVAGVIETIISRDDMFAMLPFQQVDGKAYVYNRESTLTEGNFIDPVNDTVPEGAETFTEIVTKLRVLIGDVDVDDFSIETMSDKNSQLAVQIAGRVKGIARKFHKTLVSGDATGNPNEFDGLVNLVDSDHTILAGSNGSSLTLSMLDQLCDTVPNGPDVLIMRRGTIRAYRALLRALGGTNAEQAIPENFGKVMLAHNGIPILINDYLPNNETAGANANTTSVYAVRLNEVDGLHGLFGGPNAGISIKNIGPVQNKDATRTRIRWYCGLALKSSQSAARLSGITNI